MPSIARTTPVEDSSGASEWIGEVQSKGGFNFKHMTVLMIYPSSVFSRICLRTSATGSSKSQDELNVIVFFPSDIKMPWYNFALDAVEAK